MAEAGKKPDNATHQEIHALNDKLDEFKKSSATTREEDLQFQRDAQKRSQGRVALYVTIGVFLIGAFLASVRMKMSADSISSSEARKELKESLDNLAAIQTKQAETMYKVSTDIEIMKKDIQRQGEDRQIIGELQRNVTNLLLEVERLKNK